MVTHRRENEKFWFCLWRHCPSDNPAVSIVPVHLMEGGITPFLYLVVPQIHARRCVLRITQFHEISFKIQMKINPQFYDDLFSL